MLQTFSRTDERVMCSYTHTLYTPHIHLQCGLRPSTTVTCERRREMDRNDPNMMCCERPCGKMMRSIMFPDTADLNRADIRMEARLMNDLHC
jgi:hypothetical protein